MREATNIAQVASLAPDYMGFIFYEKSPRFVAQPFSDNTKIPRVGVFVNASFDYILQTTKQYSLSVIQLHGNESPAFCAHCKEGLPEGIELWKVFSVGVSFDFSPLSDYKPFVEAFLFDTKGKAPGGNGQRFDWTLLKNYTLETPIIVSGGIGQEDVAAIKNLQKSDLPLLAIDINSKFEREPGLKDYKKIKLFIDAISC